MNNTEHDISCGNKRQRKPIHDWTRNPPPPNLTPFQDFTRSVDWSKSPLGPMQSWPNQLRQTVLLIMADPHPAVVYWGEDMTIVYNEAYTALIGQKHPDLQGQDPKIGFSEIWPQFDKIIRDGMETGETHIGGKQLLLIKRFGFLEETYFSWKFVPMVGEDGFVVASYATVFENTREVILDRRTASIRHLTQCVSAAQDIDSLWRLLLDGLEENDKDVPLAMFYSADRQPETIYCVLKGTIGIPDGHISTSQRLKLTKESKDFLGAMYAASKVEGVSLIRAEQGNMPQLDEITWRGFAVPCVEMVIVPFRNSTEDLIGFLIIGLNPRKLWDTDYENYIHLITKQVTTLRLSDLLLVEEINRGKIRAETAAKERASLSHQLQERTRAAEQSEMRFSFFADRSAVCLAIVGIDGIINYANDAWYNWTGNRKEENRPLSWLDTVTAEDLQSTKDVWRKVSVDKIPQQFQVRTDVPFENGEMRDSHSTGLCAAYPDLDEDGNMRGVMALIMNISELKWNEEQVRIRTRELEQSELKYRRFADNAPVGVCLINPEDQIEFANDAWFAIFSQTGEDVERKPWLNAVHPEDREKVQSFFANLKVCNGLSMIESRLSRSWSLSTGNDPAWFLASGYAETDVNGNLQDVVCWVTEISAQKATVRVLKERMEEAIELKRQQENFIDMISHEIRNPLSAVLSSSEEIITSLNNILTSTTSSETPWTKELPSAIEAARTISYCVQHQKRIVDDVLTLSKLDSDLLTFSPVPVKPTAIAEEVFKLFEGELRSTDMTLEVHEDSSLQEFGVEWLMLDPHRLLQVLINLTTNAIKFTSTSKTRRITITIAVSKTRPSDDPADGIDYFPQRAKQAEPHNEKADVFLKMSVKDTGKGISSEEKSLLFKRFSQTSLKTQVQYGGSGLGLFISCQITEMQGGEMGVVSEPGQGSTFAFFVKARRIAAPRRPSSAEGILYSAKGNHSVGKNDATGAMGHNERDSKLRVLVVEDNLVNQRVLVKQLRKHGFTVGVASHGLEALETLRKESFDVICCDLEMPVMDGLTAIREIRRLESEGAMKGRIPALAVTANVRSAHVEAAMEAGMDGVTTKPYRIDDLLAQIDRVCRC